jgi:hypothetical protein
MYQTFAAACIEYHQAPDPRLAVLEGPVFRALVLRPDGTTDLEAFAALWPHMRVMARCTPADKFTLVQVRGYLLAADVCARAPLPANKVEVFGHP